MNYAARPVKRLDRVFLIGLSLVLLTFAVMLVMLPGSVGRGGR